MKDKLHRYIYSIDTPNRLELQRAKRNATVYLSPQLYNEELYLAKGGNAGVAAQAIATKSRHALVFYDA